MKLSVSLLDTNARRRVRRLPDNMKALASQEVEHYAQLVYNKAVSDTPVLTGELVATTKLERYASDGTAWRVSQEGPKALWTEFGTGRRGAASNRERLPEGYSHGPSAGQAAQPHLIPALRLYQAPLVAAIKRAALKGALKK